jgi:hypothetical protein
MVTHLRRGSGVDIVSMEVAVANFVVTSSQYSCSLGKERPCLSVAMVHGKDVIIEFSITATMYRNRAGNVSATSISCPLPFNVVVKDI